MNLLERITICHLFMKMYLYQLLGELVLYGHLESYFLVIILEAMKMENILSSPVDGIVKEIKVNPQQTVEKNNILIKFKP